MTKQNRTALARKYGPGFLAISKKTGRVLASGKEFGKMWKKAEKKKVNFSKVVITHVPKYGARSAYRISLSVYIDPKIR